MLPRCMVRTIAWIPRRGISAASPPTSLWHPIGLALDPAGSLWVTDFYNQRVLQFPRPGSTQADKAIQVLGQGKRFNTNTCGVTREALCGPTSISFDGLGDAFIVDGLNSRMLEYTAPGT